MFPARLRDAWFSATWKTLAAFFLVIVLLSAPACAPLPPPLPSQMATPSKVVTEEGMEFYVWDLKLPGTRQQLKLKQGDALIWLPLNIVGLIHFSGPVTDSYRRADLTLTSGEKVQGELFVGHLVEGNTDIGYWNMSLERLRALSIGTQ